MTPTWGGAEGSPINDVPEPDDARPRGGGLINAGAVIAVLLGIPCIFIGMYGVIGVLTGGEIIAGFLGAVWGYGAVAGAYELNRRKFEWQRGRRYGDHHLLAGTLAVSLGLVVSGAINETMPALALVPALSAMKQASDGHETRLLTWIHAGLLVAGGGAGIWLFRNEGIGKMLLLRLVELP